MIRRTTFSSFQNLVKGVSIGRKIWGSVGHTGSEFYYTTGWKYCTEEALKEGRNEGPRCRPHRQTSG